MYTVTMRNKHSVCVCGNQKITENNKIYPCILLKTVSLPVVTYFIVIIGTLG